MATIASVETPFDQVSKEELNDWLGHPVTNKLLAACEQNRNQVRDRILQPMAFERASNDEIAIWYRWMRATEGALANVIDWIKGANRA
jgi:hypothetical protein